MSYVSVSLWGVPVVNSHRPVVAGAAQCLDCGVLVYDTTASKTLHDGWHARTLPARAGALVRRAVAALPRVHIERQESDRG